MRLLLLDQFSDMGGAQQCLLALLPAIAARGWQATVGLPGEGEMFVRVRSLGFETAAIDCGPYESGRKSAADVGRFAAGTPRLVQQIRRLADRIDADLVYCNGPRLLPAAALAALARPILFHCHSYLAPGAARRLAGLSLRQMKARVVGQCEYVAEPWRRYVGAERVSVIYNGVAGPAQAAARHSGATPRVGCIGRIAPEKGQLEFVATAARIHQSLPACRFVIYGAPLFGDAGAAHYEARVHKAAAALPIEFPGWVDDVYHTMEQLDLLLVTSTGVEATTRVILEAFAAGLPVIAFRSGGIPEVIEHGVNGLLADSIDEMTQQSIRLLSADSQVRVDMSRAARETWERRFTLERYQEEMLRACFRNSVR